jgi:hypothetical protein
MSRAGPEFIRRTDRLRASVEVVTWGLPDTLAPSFPTHFGIRRRQKGDTSHQEQISTVCNAHLLGIKVLLKAGLRIAECRRPIGTEDARRLQTAPHLPRPRP